MILITHALVASILAAASFQEAEPAPASEFPAIVETAELLIGSFTTLPQAERDARYGYVESEVVRVWPQRTDGIWLYQENAWLGDTPGEADMSAKARPYFQRIIHIGLAGEHAVRRTSYAVTNPAALAGAWQAPERVTEDDLGAATCSGISERIAQGYWVAEFDCANSLRGAVRAISRSITTPNEYANWDLGLDVDGARVWGPTFGGYIFTRQPADQQGVDE